LPPVSSQPDADQSFPGYYRVGHGVSAPKAINAPTPQYDPESRALGVEGTAVFQVGVAPEGRIKDVRVAKSGGLPQSLLRNAEDTLRQWMFEPARKEGEPVPVRLNVEINFRIR
jgi:protein TonB